jgi:succinate dehydrogenase / fumarate reductase flavoprotein subunit
VYLDVTHIPADVLRRKIGGVIEMYEKFVGDDPTKVPMRIFPGMHYSMGGLWVDYEANDKGDVIPSPRNQQTNIPGLFATGECDYQYHGANRLGANSLLSCIYAGMIGGPAMIQYAQNAAKGTASSAEPSLEESRKRWRSRIDDIYKMKAVAGQKVENPYGIHVELGDLMTENCTVIRYNDKLRAAEQKIIELKGRWKHVANLDDSPRANQAVAFTNQLWNMLEMAHAMVKGALLRDECRGSHYKPDFDFKPAAGKKPQEDPAFMEKWRANLEKWDKTTIASYKPAGPEISFRPVPFPILKPEPRHYD